MKCKIHSANSGTHKKIFFFSFLSRSDKNMLVEIACIVNYHPKSCMQKRYISNTNGAWLNRNTLRHQNEPTKLFLIHYNFSVILYYYSMFMVTTFLGFPLVDCSWWFRFKLLLPLNAGNGPNLPLPLPVGHTTTRSNRISCGRYQLCSPYRHCSRLAFLLRKKEIRELVSHPRF